MATNKNTFGLGPLDRIEAEYLGLGQALQNSNRGIAADQSDAGQPQMPQVRQQDTPAMPDTRQPTTYSPGRGQDNLLPPTEYVPLFEQAARKYDVPVNVLMALGHQESRYNPNAVGVETKWGKAKGLMQYLDSTAKMMGINPYIPEQAIDAAARQIRDRLDKGYSMEDAVKEHFAGPDRKLWGAKTRQYGVDVLGKAQAIRDGMYADLYRAQTEPQIAAQQAAEPSFADVDMPAAETEQPSFNSVLAAQAGQAGGVDPALTAQAGKGQDNGLMGLIGDRATGGFDQMARSLGVARAVVGGRWDDETIDTVSQAIVKSIEDGKKRQDSLHAQEKEIEASLKRFGESEGFMGTLGAAGDVAWTGITNPIGLGLGTLEQASNMLPTVAGGIGGAVTGAGVGGAAGSVIPGAGTAAGAALGAGIGGRAGMAAGTAVVEFGFEIQEAIQDRLAKTNTMPTAANIKAVLADPAFRSEIEKQAAIKGVTLAAVDALSFGLAGRVASAPTKAAEKKAIKELADSQNVSEAAARKMLGTEAGKQALEAAAPSVGKRVAAGAGAVGIEMAGEPAGEALSQLAARGEIDKADVAAEALYGAATSVGTAAAARGYQAASDAAREVAGGATVYSDGKGDTVIVPNESETLALPPPSIEVGPDGTARTTEQRNRERSQDAVMREAQARRDYELGNDSSVRPYEATDGAVVIEEPGAAAPRQPAQRQPVQRPIPQKPTGPIGRAIQAGEQEAQAKRVVIETPVGSMGGFLEAYQQDQQGGFVARVLGDDGQLHQFTQADGVTIRPEGQQPAAPAVPAEPLNVDPETGEILTQQGAQDAGAILDDGAAGIEAAGADGRSQADPGPALADVPETGRPDPEQPQQPVRESTPDAATAAQQPDALKRADIDSMTQEQVQSRLDYLTGQARTNGGWSKKAAAEKQKLDAALQKFQVANVEVNPDESPFNAPAKQTVTPRETDVTTQQGKPLIELFHPSEGIHVLVRKDQWEAGDERLPSFTRAGTRQVGTLQTVSRAALASPVEPSQQASTNEASAETQAQAVPVQEDGIVEPDVPESAYVDAVAADPAPVSAAPTGEKTQRNIEETAPTNRGKRSPAKASKEPQAANAPDAVVDDELLGIARRETDNANSQVRNDIERDQAGVIPGKPTIINRSLKRGHYTLEQMAAGWENTRAKLRERHGETVVLYRADERPENWHADTQVVYMGDKNLAQHFARDGRKVQAFTVPVDDIVAVNARRSGYYEFIVKRQGEPMAADPTPAGATEASTAPAESAPANTPKQDKAKKPSRKEQADLRRRMTDEYFTPGNVVKSYGGYDRVLAYSPPDENGNWSVQVQAVRKEGGKWVDVPNERVRTHSTLPSDRELRAGPADHSQMPPAAPEAAPSAAFAGAETAPAVAESNQAPTAQEPAATQATTDPRPSPDAALFANNKIFTADAVEKARARLRSKLGQINSGIDPEVLIDGMTIAGAYIEGGIRNFSEYAQRLTADLGDGIKPYLLSFWEGARNYPGLNAEGMTSVEDSKAQFEALLTPADAQTEAVGEVQPKPRKRTPKTGKATDRTLVQDWGVDNIDGWTETADGQGEGSDFGLVGGVKDAFLKDARAYLNAVAKVMTEQGYTVHDAKGKPMKAVHVSEGGPAVSGDVTLTLRHADTGVNAYVHISAGALRGMVPSTTSGVSVMYRVSRTEGDTYATRGNGNRWAPVDLSAADLAEMVDKEALGIAKRPAAITMQSTEADENGQSTQQAVQAADRAGVPADGAGREPAAQQGSAPADTGNLEAGQPQNVGQPATGEPGRAPGLRPATTDVGAAGRTDESRPAGDGRPRTGGAGNADARTGAAGRGKPARTERVSTTKKPETVSPANEGPGDFVIDDPLRIVGGGQVARFDKNRAAIELRNALLDEGRKPTREEQEVLAGYTGWGSFGQELFQGTWANPKPKAGWEARDTWLRDNLGQKEWEGMQRSIINAHYTDPPTIMAMWDMARRMGFDGGRVLEPSIGIGNFFGMMPADMAGRSNRAGIELDPVTGSMAQLLYPGANIQIMGYEQSKTPDNFYDLVIGNWPFADYSPADRRYNRVSPLLHDYFFLKALDQTRPGGLVIGITSKGTMDKKASNVRTEIAKRGELVAAFRLPSGAFEEFAGTKVVTDIIILRKRAEPAGVVAGEGWIKVKPHDTKEGTQVDVNEYYHAHPDHVIGEIDFGHGTTTFRPGLIVHRPENMMEQLRRIVDMVPEGAYRKDARGQQISYITNHTSDRTNSLVKTDDGLFVVRGEYLAPANEVQKYTLKSETATAEREAQLSKLIDMRRMYGELIEAERGTGDATAQRKALRAAFDAFKKEHGDYSGSFGLKYLRQIDDPFYPALAALEFAATDDKGKVTYKPAAILSGSTTRGAKTMANPSIADAFVLARNESVNPSPEQIAAIAGQPVEAVRQALVENGAAFETPSGDFIPSDMYLSGNVREKLRQAQAGLEAGNQAMQRNIDALQAVLPEDIPYYKIETQFGATWVPPSAYADYIAHMLGLPNTADIKVAFQAGAWKVDFPAHFNSRTEAKNGFGTPALPFKRLVRAAIANQTVTIKEKDSDGKEYVDVEATKEANARIADMRLKFGEWLWSDPERRVDLEHEYNETRNAYATPTFDGSFLGFQGMALSLGRGPFDLRQHQVNAIWRALVTKKSLNAHEVGTGKTFTMGGIAVESRRYGIAKKPMLFAHNANSKTVAAEIQQMYPAAKILYVDNLSKENLATRMMQIANDDWDVVVLPHSLIDRIGFKEETLMDMAQQELDDLEAAAREAAQEEGVQFDDAMLDDEDELVKLRSVTAKQLVKQRLRIVETIKKLAQQASREDSIAFEDLGVDMVLVDEAHEFKKPPIATKMKMKGLQTQTSNRSIAMSFITRYVRGMNNGGNVHLFTGTPITNTMTEVFHMMRYMMLEEMEASSLADWDGWFGSFAREIEDVELSSTGEYETVTRLQSFINVPELRRMIGQYMDVVFADDMPEMQPRKVNGKTLADPTLTEAERAQLLNGRTENAADRPYKKVVNESADMSPDQMRVFERVQRLANEWRNMSKKARKEAMARGDETVPIIHDGIAERASFDVRLVDAIGNAGKEGTPEMAPHPSSKPARVLKNLIDIYNSDPRANQVVFMEQGMSTSVTRSEGEPGEKKQVRYKAFSTLNDMIERLVQAGIPREQIAAVTGSTSKDKRKEIAEAMNRGDIRIVFGSTDSLGVGVNMQKNLRAMHHMDAPWMPGELEQRNGRGHRQGNQWNTVMEYRYLTDRLDGRRWQVLAIKQRFITDFMKSKGEARVIEGDAASDEQGDILSTFADAAGDPRILVREKLKKKLEGLNSRERLHTHAQADAARQVRRLKESIAGTRQSIKTMRDNKVAQKVDALLNAQRGDSYRATILGKEFSNSTEARDYVRDTLPSEMRMGQEKKIGTYGGYDLHAVWGPHDTEPSLYIEIGGQVVESNGPSLPSLNNALRDLRESVPALENRVSEQEKTLGRMEAVSQEPFHLGAQLAAVQKQLADLERDIAENPVAPPHWLRSGAPVDTAVMWNGKEFTVTGHRWNDQGWYVLAEDESGSVAIPYLAAQDAQGMALYEEREFTPPKVVEKQPEEGQAQAKPTDGGVAFSVAPATETAAFKKWFGDSKVVDADGKPLVVYHGARPGVSIENFKARHETDGIYFTPDASYAESYTEDLFSDEDAKGAIYPVYLSIQKPYIVEAAYGSDEWNSFVDRGINRVELKRRGFDGAILREPDGTIDQIIAFHPEQIKSATGNRGTFDAANPDITYSVGTDAGTLKASVKGTAELTQQKPMSVRSTAAQRAMSQQDLRDAVFADLRDRTDLSHPEIGAIAINRKGWSKSRANANDRAKLLTVPHLADIISNGTYLGSNPAVGKPGTVGYHYIGRRVTVDGVPLTALVTVEESRESGLHYYNHTMLNDLAPGRTTEPVDGLAASYRRPSFTPDGRQSRRDALPATHNNVLETIMAGPLGSVVDKLIGEGHITLHQDEASLPRSIKLRGGAAIQGFTDGDGRIHLVAESLTAQTAMPVLLHEMFHAGGQRLIGTAKWNNLMQQMGRYHDAALRRQAEGRVQDGDFWDGVLRRVQAAQAEGAISPERMAEEMGAYAIEHYELAPSGIKKWVDTIIGMVKDWLLRRFGIQAGAVTPAQLRALAVAALRQTQNMRPVAGDTLGGSALGAGGLMSVKDQKDAMLNEAIAALDDTGPESPVRGDFIGQAISDMTGVRSLYSRFLAHPYQIASTYSEFTPVFQTATAQQQTRNEIIEDLHQDHRPYADLPKKSKAAVNRVLELGRLAGHSWTKEQVMEGVRNTGYIYTVVMDDEGIPHRVRKDLNAQLSKPGETLTLTEAEAEAYLSLRQMFDRALDRFRDQALDDLGLGRFIGQSDAAKAIMDAAQSLPPIESRSMENAAQFIQDIEQAKRTGYVPLTRYGDYVVAVKERQHDIQYINAVDDYVYAINVPDHLVDYVDSIGGTYDRAEQAWILTEQQREDLERQNEITVYSEKVETGLRDMFGRNSERNVKMRKGAVSDIPTVKQAIDRVAREQVGDNPRRRIVTFATSKKEAAGNVDLSSLDALAEVAMLDQATWDAVRNQLARALQSGGFRKHFFQSSNVAGYSADFERSIADYIVGLSGYLSRRQHSKDWDKAVAGIKGPNLHKYATKYREYVNQPAEEMAMLRQTGFFLYIAGNISSAILNMTQVPLMTMPFLSMITNHARATAEMARAYKDALVMMRVNRKTGFDLFDFSNAPADIRDDLKKASDEGLLLPLQSLEIMGIAGRKSIEGREAQKVYDRTVQTVALPFTATERLNRVVTFIAANRLARKDGIRSKIRSVFKNNPQAMAMFSGKNFSPYAFAEFAVDETQFRMGKGNRPTAMRGVGTAIMQFKSFMLQFFEAMYRNWTLHGKEGKMATAATLGMMVAMSGLWGAPGADDLRELLEGMYKGITGRDLDTRTALRKWVYETTNQQWLASLVDGGFPYAAGADMSRRIGMGQIMPDSRSPTGIPWMDSLIAFGGVPADMLIGRPLRAAQNVGTGDITGGVTAFLPNFIENARKARNWATDGVRTAAGRMVLPEDQVNTSSVVMKAVGIQPSQVSDVYAYNEAQRRSQASLDTLKRRYLSDYVRALGAIKRNTDPEKAPQLQAEAQKIIKDVSELNKTLAPHQRITLGREAIKNQILNEMKGAPAGFGRERKQARGEAAALREVFGVQ